MRLVFIYGPPGAGKLTVARELAALTGLKLFHNHLTVDLVSSVFPRGHPSFGPLITCFRREIFAESLTLDVTNLPHQKPPPRSPLTTRCRSCVSR